MKRASKHIRLHQQNGQAMVLGLLLASVIVIGFLATISLNKVIADKVHQVHTSDATVYSAALSATRSLNFQAYINRAQIAHQVAMAHLVTLGSWMHFTSSNGRQATRFNPPPYVITMMFGSQHTKAYVSSVPAALMSHLSGPNSPLAQAFAQHDKAVHHILNNVSKQINETMPSVIQRTAQEILQKNYSEFQLIPLESSNTLEKNQLNWQLNILNWNNYIKRFQPDQYYYSLLKEVTALYDFLNPRNHTKQNNWVVYPQCPHMRHELRRRGKTDLDSNGNWQASDTQSYHAVRYNKYIGCYYREYPMGWAWIPGKAEQADFEYVEDAPDNFSSTAFWRWVQKNTSWDILNGMANPLSNTRAVSSRQRWSGGGLANYFDINKRNESLQLELKIAHLSEKNLRLSSISHAESFYSRPQARQDKKSESNNLWQPYWQARLISPLRSTE